MEIVTRDDLIRLLRQMALPNWLGGKTERMTIARAAADVIETYGKSADDTQKNIAEIHESVARLAARLPD